MQRPCFPAGTIHQPRLYLADGTFCVAVEFMGGCRFDRTGMELPDDAAALACAGTASKMMGDLSRYDRPVAGRAIIVRDEDRRLIGRVALDEYGSQRQPPGTLTNTSSGLNRQ
jgi:hypothetical protein